MNDRDDIRYMSHEFAPDDPRHLDEIVDHCANLRDEQLLELEGKLRVIFDSAREMAALNEDDEREVPEREPDMAHPDPAERAKAEALLDCYDCLRAAGLTPPPEAPREGLPPAQAPGPADVE